MTTKTDILKIAEQDYDPSFVRINYAVIDAMDRSQIDGGGGANLTEGTSNMSLSEAISYAIALNSINYRFWDLQDGQMLRYQHEGKVGALAMTSAFERAWNREHNSFAQLSQPLTEDDILAVFGDMPGRVSRVAILNEVLLSPKLREVSEKLAEDITQAEGVFILGVEHAQTLADAFPLTYTDPLLKKAQLAISAVWLACAQRGLNVDTDLTAFADYQIPRILRALGVIEYSAEVAAIIDSMQLIESGSKIERAIRSASVGAVEAIAKKHNVRSAPVDHYLWTRRNEAKEPFHLCDTTAY